MKARPTTKAALGVRLDDGLPAHLDLEALRASRMVVTAMSGGGKSYLLRKILEIAWGAMPQIIFDPEGEFYTLRDRYAHVLVGRPAGRAGDLPAAIAHAPQLARRLMETGASAVIDLSEMDEGEQQVYVRDFVTALLELPRELWRPALIVFDEAQIFIPEKGHDESVSAKPVRRLMTRGRKRGFATLLASQRLTSIDKTAVAQARNYLIGQSDMDIDSKRAAATLGMSADAARAALRDLEPGEFFAFGPAISRKITRLKVGKVETRHPEPGTAMALPPPTSADMKALIAKFNAIPQEAEAEAGELAGLRTQVASLQAKLRELERQPPPISDEMRQAALADARMCERRAAISGVVHGVNDFWSKANDAYGQLVNFLGDVAKDESAINRDRIGLPPVAPAPGRRTVSIQPVTPRRPPPMDAEEAAPHGPPPRHSNPHKTSSPTSPAADGAAPSNTQRKILDAIAWFETVGIESPTTVQVALKAGYTATGGTFINLRGACRTAGWISYEGGTLALTSAGRRFARAPASRPTNAEMQDAALEVVSSGPARKLLRVLLERGQRNMTSEELADATGYTATGGTFINLRGHLKTLGLVVYPQRGYVRASDVLFPETRR